LDDDQLKLVVRVLGAPLDDLVLRRAPDMLVNLRFVGRVAGIDDLDRSLVDVVAMPVRL
jgi:hypothetical protein